MYRVAHTLLALLLLASGACDADGRGEHGTETIPATTSAAPAPPVVEAPPEPPLPPPPPPPPLPISAIQGSFQGIPSGLRDAVSGQVRFTTADGGVLVSISVRGLPSGLKAAHVHEKGDCSDLPGKSAGEHFNPEGEIHGLPDAAKHHRGDVGDVQVTEEGVGTLELRVPRVNLTRGDPRSLLERAVVIRSVREDGLGLKVGRPLACAVVSEHIAGAVLTPAQLEEETARRAKAEAAAANDEVGGSEATHKTAR